MSLLVVSILTAVGACGGGSGGSDDDTGAPPEEPAPTPPENPPPEPPEDPGSQSLVFATFMGGSAEDTVRDVAFDSAGNAYLVGGTASPNFPTTAGVYQRQLNSGSNGASFGAHDVWVAKLDPQGNLLWSTLVGGGGYDRAYAVEVDAGGIYVAGRAGIGFPVTGSALQGSFAGDSDPNPGYGPQDGFVFKLAPDGSGLLWSTYFGDAGREFIRDLDIDAQGNVYVAATSVHEPSQHVTPQAFQTTLPPGSSGLVAKIAADGGSVEWGTFLGGSGTDLGNPSIRVDGNGRVIVAGMSDSTDFPVAGTNQTTLAGGTDVTVTAITADGSQLDFSAYFGGSGEEGMETHSLALAPSGDIYVAFGTSSTDLPISGGAYQPIHGGASSFDIGIARFSSTGSFTASTYLGGPRSDGLEGIAVASDGSVVVSGQTQSPEFPVVGDGANDRHAGGVDGIVTVLTANLDDVVFSSFFGGTGEDTGRCLAVSGTDDLLIGAMTYSSDFPVTDGSSYSSERDAAILLFRR